jgi:hypothetical protein
MPLTSACQVTGRLPGLGTDGFAGSPIHAVWNAFTAASVRGPTIPSTAIT